MIYPISGHWIWDGGWLAQLGFHDFAGSTAVHMVGGVAALVGVKILGSRLGKYSGSDKSRAIPGHSLTLGALGGLVAGAFALGGSSEPVPAAAVSMASAIPVEQVVDIVKQSLYTGSFGDGKIFVYDVDNVIKVRTGEEGYDALQDDEYNSAPA